MSHVESATVLETAKRRAIRPREADQCVILYGIGWAEYRRLYRARGERSRPRMTYLDGDLYLMSPGHLHESDKAKLDDFVTVVTEEFDIPCNKAGSTTYRRPKKEAGIEPDQSYYLINAPRILNKKKINLRIDPPPDLSIEVVYSNSAKAAIEVSRRFGIPEVWVCTERGLRFLVLGPSGRYAELPTSPTFPFITAAEIVDWIRRPLAEGTTETNWRKDLRRWVQEVLIPRVANRPE